MPPPIYRAGIIGLGFIGGGDSISGDRLGQRVADLDGHHRQALSSHPRVQLVAGTSRDPGQCERFAQLTAARTYPEARQMLAAEPLDIVSIATYAPSHAELAELCAEHGVRAIYCEKPIATRLADAERMLAACARTGTLLVVNHNRRFHATFRDLASRLAAGEIGELTGGWLTWGTGRLGNVGTHFIDAACLLTGQTVQRVSATLDGAGRPDCRGPEFRDPGGWGLLHMTGGLIVHLHAPDYGNSPGEILLHGTRGRARIGRVAEIEPWTGSPVTLPARSPQEGTSMDQAVREIVAWLDDGTPPCCPAAAAVHALEVIVACHASHARQAVWTTIPLTPPDRNLVVHSG